MSDETRNPGLAARLEHLEDLFENAPCGYVVLLPSGFVRDANATFCRWIEQPVADVRGKRFTDLLGISGKVFFETHCRPLLRMQGFVYEIALDLQSASGERIPVVLNAIEKREDDGAHVETRMIVARAVDRRRYERGLVDARDAARRELSDERSTAELREQFIAVLGHDLRNPIFGILGVADYLRRETLSEKGTQLVRLMKASAQRMASLVDNILDFARGRLGGGIPLEISVTEPIDRTLVQVVDELRIAHPQREIVVRSHVMRAFPLDHRRIAQVVSNLVGNALTHGAADRPILVQCTVEGDLFELSVANAGTPIAPAAMERLFLPFFREDVRAGQQGLGLGLYIVAEIVRAHGGTISVDSNDIETRFTIRIADVTAGSGPVDAV